MRKLLALLTAGILLATCSAEGSADTSTTTTSAPDTTTTHAPPDTTTTVPPAMSSTTAVPDTTTTVTAQLGPEGSGCTPGTNVLPDGVWYGLVADFDDDGISFDLACWFSGDAATAAAAEDGEESPPPNDYYVRNQNAQLRELEVAPDTSVLWYLSGDPSDSQEGMFSEWVDFLETQDFQLAIWVTISNGEVTDIEEQWVP
ncbi:MAG TPA: hypothetical protein VF148_05230 [Acidimicrobiia bacterium]